MSKCKKKKRGRIKDSINRIRYEMHCIDLKMAVICGICVLIGGIVSFCIGGSPTYLLRMLKMPAGLPTRWFFKVSWTLFYFLLGAAFGTVLVCKERCKQIHKYQGNMFFVIMCVFNYIWYPLFFGAEAVFLALVACVAMVILDYFVMRNYFKVNFLCGCIAFLHMVWLGYMLCLNAIILFIN